MIAKIKQHFQRVDPILYSAIKNLDLLEKASPENYFAKLCGEIINQQLSDKASATIFARFKKLYPGGKITPEYTLKLSHEKIRSVGPSNAKVKFIRELGQKVVNGEVSLEKFDGLNDETVITELTKIKGIGPWTPEKVGRHYQKMVALPDLRLPDSVANHRLITLKILTLVCLVSKENRPYHEFRI